MRSLFMIMLFVPFLAFAQDKAAVAVDAVKAAPAAVADAAAPVVEAASEAAVVVGGADIDALIKAIGGVQGGGTLAIIMLLVQLLMWLLNGFLKDKAGKYKLVAVLGLTMIAGVVALMMQGMTLGAALLHSSTIASVQVLLNQAYKQFFVKTS